MRVSNLVLVKNALYWIEFNRCYYLNSFPKYYSIGFRGFDTFEQTIDYHCKKKKFVQAKFKSIKQRNH